jgi:hypothetical protein
MKTARCPAPAERHTARGPITDAVPLSEPDLAEYDAKIGKTDAGYRVHLDAYRAELLQRAAELPRAEREAAAKKLRADWWHEDFKRDLDAHVRRAGLLESIRQTAASSARLRRSEERLSVTLLEGAVRFRKYGKPPTIDTLRQYLRVKTEPDAPEIPEFRADAERLAKELGVRIWWTVPVPINAYAWETRHEIEVSGATSEEALAVIGHELGHCAEPCEPTHRRVPRESGRGELCCACEIAAWQWASMSLCRWSDAMHDEMGRCLRTYRRYGTAAEQVAMDTLCGTRSRAEIRLKRTIR